MIQNPTITEKLKQKTSDNPEMRNFIEVILDNEAAGKNYKKLFEAEAAKIIAQKQKEGHK